MPRGYRSALVAAGLVLLGLGGQAQENEQEPGRQADQEEPRTEFTPIPIEIVEDEAEAEARKRHEAEAREREIADLRAQQGMNEATQAMEFYSWLSTIVVAIGTAAVLASLGLMWDANRAAVAAVAVTREIGEAQVRGYLLVESVTANINDRGQLEIAVEVENTGLSPLLGVQVYCLIRFVTPETEVVLISDFGENGRSLKVVKSIHLRPGMPQDYVRTFDLKGAEHSWLNADDACAVVVEVDLITLAGDVFGRNIYGHERWGLKDEIRGAHVQMRLKNVYATSIDELDRFEWYGIQIGQMWPLAVDQHR